MKTKFGVKCKPLKIMGRDLQIQDRNYTTQSIYNRGGVAQIPSRFLCM